MLYCEAITNLMYAVSNQYAPQNINDLFTKQSDIHTYNTRSSAADNFYMKHLRLGLQKHSFSKTVVKLWNRLFA